MPLLELKPSSERRTITGTDFGSLLLSLGFHALLALLLWCLVISVTRPESIFLIGSTSTGKESVSIDLATAEMSPSQAEESIVAEETGSERSDAAIDALIAQAMEASTLASSNAPRHEQPSIEFFGTRAFGRRFVFVLDISYSMKARRGERFRRACDELVRAVSQLQAGQSYYVFLFCWNLDEMFFDRNIQYVQVREGHETKLRNWIYDVSLGAGTDPRRALSLAHQMKPDAVFLLSDGQFNQPRTPMSESGWLDERGERVDISVQEGAKMIYKDLPIHTIAFENPFTKTAMEAISDATGGEFKYVNTETLVPVDSQRFLTSLQQIEQKHRHERDPAREYQTRLSLARELLSDGELLFAEYIVRPLRHAPPSSILNPTLLNNVLSILRSEVGDARLEDFEQPPELRQILADDTSETW